MSIYTEAEANLPPGLVTGDYVPLGVEAFNKAFAKFLHVLAGLQPEDEGFEPGPQTDTRRRHNHGRGHAVQSSHAYGRRLAARLGQASMLPMARRDRPGHRARQEVRQVQER